VGDGRSLGQKLSWRERLAKPDARFGRRDWIGDAVLALLAGVAVVAGTFLPFANDKTGDLNYSATQAQGLHSSFAAGFGWPMLAFGLLAAGLAVAMLVLGPRRNALYLGVGLSVTGLLVIGQAGHAAASINFWGGDTIGPGLGLFVTSLAGILLVPIGIASGLVAWILTSRRFLERVAPDPPAAVPAAAEKRPDPGPPDARA
jgi:hypothetical protein